MSGVAIASSSKTDLPALTHGPRSCWPTRLALAIKVPVNPSFEILLGVNRRDNVIEDDRLIDEDKAARWTAQDGGALHILQYSPENISLTEIAVDLLLKVRLHLSTRRLRVMIFPGSFDGQLPHQLGGLVLLTSELELQTKHPVTQPHKNNIEHRIRATAHSQDACEPLGRGRYRHQNTDGNPKRSPEQELARPDNAFAKP